MNTDIIKGKWDIIKGKIRQEWNKFTDDEVGQMKGTYEELHGYLQKKYGHDKEEAKNEINNFIRKNRWNREDD